MEVEGFMQYKITGLARSLTLATVAALGLGCGSTDINGIPEFDAMGDVPEVMDGASDTGADPGTDLGPDMPVDAPGDFIPDPGVDTTSDAPPDSVTDPGVDAPGDTTVDSGVDALPDAVTDPDTDTPTLGYVGDACTSASDCMGVSSPDRECMTAFMGMIELPGGYCSAACTSDGECGPSGECVELFGFGSFCLRICSSVGECRTSEGYTCSTLPGGSGSYCLPPMGPGVTDDGTAVDY